MKKFFSLIAAVLFAGSMMADVVTITPENCGWNGTAGAQSGVVEGVTVANSNGLAGTDQSTGVAAMRIYKNATLTISAEQTITSIVFTCAANGAEKYGPGSFGAMEGYTFDAEGPTGTWTGAATSVTFTAANNQVRATQIVVTLDGDVPPIGAPKYYVVGTMNEWAADEAYELKANPATEGEYMAEFTFAANDEFKVIGIVGDETIWYPGGTGNNYVINEAGDYKVFFRPDGQGGEGWYEGVIYVIMKEPALTISCADVYNLAKNDEVALNDVVVTYANGKNVYVKDETGAMLIFLPTADAANWAAGDVLAGIEGKVDIYNGLYEVKPSADQVAAVTATPGEAPAPEELTAAPTAADVNKYVIIKNVKVEAATFPENKNMNATVGTETFVLRNQFGADIAFDITKAYDITGAVAVYNSTVQLYFIGAQESAQQAIENTKVENGAVKFFENGQLIIEKNGVRFNAIGTRL